MAPHIQIKFPIMQFFVLILTCTSSEYSFYSGNKFHHSKRLGNIIICSALQSFYFIKFRFLGRYHDHRNILHRRHTFQLCQDCIAIISRKHDIQKNKLRDFFFNCFHQLSTITKASGFESCCLQCINKKFSDITFIFHTIDHLFLPSSLFFSILIFLYLYKSEPCILPKFHYPNQENPLL